MARWAAVGGGGQGAGQVRRRRQGDLRQVGWRGAGAAASQGGHRAAGRQLPPTSEQQLLAEGQHQGTQGGHVGPQGAASHAHQFLAQPAKAGQARPRPPMSPDAQEGLHTWALCTLAVVAPLMRMHERCTRALLPHWLHRTATNRAPQLSRHAAASAPAPATHCTPLMPNSSSFSYTQLNAWSSAASMVRTRCLSVYLARLRGG